MNEPRIEGDDVVLGSGRSLRLEELGALAEQLPWIAANVFIMPPHEYVVMNKLKTEAARETFEALRVACLSHPASWKAFFRAYKAKNRYLVIGEYRYWYTQIRGARMMNRCDREKEMENTRGAQGERAIKRWSGCAYAWRREYGIECEHLPKYCNLVVMEEVDPGGDMVVARYAPMVARIAVDAWCERVGAAEPTLGVVERVRRAVDGVRWVEGVPPANSRKVETPEAEVGLGATWMRQKDMSASRVATDLRWFSTSPELQVERVVALPVAGNYLVQLTVPAIS